MSWRGGSGGGVWRGGLAGRAGGGPGLGAGLGAGLGPGLGAGPRAGLGPGAGAGAMEMDVDIFDRCPREHHRVMTDQPSLLLRMRTLTHTSPVPPVPDWVGFDWFGLVWSGLGWVGQLAVRRVFCQARASGRG
jgi:hypothetical protein